MLPYRVYTQTNGAAFYYKLLVVGSILLFIYSNMNYVIVPLKPNFRSSTFALAPLEASISRIISRSQPSFPKPFTEEPNGLMVHSGKYVAARSLSSEHTRKRSRLFSSVSRYASVSEMSCCSN